MRKRGLLKVLILILFLILNLLPLQLYLAGNWYSFFSEWTLAMVFGLIAFTQFQVVLVLSARVRLLDYLFGHDKVMLTHGLLAVSALVFAFAHRQLKLLYNTEPDLQMRLGTTGFLVFLSIMGLTLLFMVPNILHRIGFMDRLRRFVNERLRLDYTVFKVIHNCFSIALIIISLHVFLASSTGENNARLAYVGVTFGLALLAYIYHKFLRPFVNRRRALVVRKVQLSNRSVLHIDIISKTGKLPRYKAGQFAFFRFLSRAVGSEEHPFTLSSSPGEGHISIHVKDLGSYSRALRGLQEGDEVIMDGPYGLFSPRSQEQPLLFIAGGIGITPFMSILQHIRREGGETDLTLVWACRKREDLFHHRRLLELSREMPHFNYLPLLSDEDWEGETGLVTREWLEQRLSLGKNTSVYLCGPGIMMREVSRVLKSMGIREVHTEKFSL